MHGAAAGAGLSLMLMLMLMCDFVLAEFNLGTSCDVGAWWACAWASSTACCQPPSCSAEPAPRALSKAFWPPGLVRQPPDALI